MFHGLSHVDIPVSSLDRALTLYRDLLGFPEASSGDGWVDINAATSLIRLIESKQVERVVSLRIEVTEVPAAVDTLVNEGVELLYPPERTEQLTFEATVADPDGNRITLWRALSEDEYGFDPELPTEMTWDEDAEALLKTLLRAVPALFRGLARRKIVKEAERRAGKKMRVDRELMIRSYISAQSRPNRGRLIEPLQSQGIDPDDYKDEFES